MKDYNIIVILGPTASGKTELSLEIAKQVNGEIINADAFQVYKKMDIGTGKILPEELQGIKHHLIDIIDYDQEFDVSIYQILARQTIDNIINNNKVPILIGGSNLYLDSVIYDYQFTQNDKLQETIKKYEEYSLEDLQNIIDSKNITINNSEYHNHKRLARIIAKDELNIDNNNNKHKLLYKPLFIKIDTNREVLYDKINMRVEKMFELGLVEEVKQFDQSFTSQQAIGYKEVHQYLNNEIDLNTCIDLVKQKSRNYAKRQITWISKIDADVIVRKEDNIWNTIN